MSFETHISRRLEGDLQRQIFKRRFFIEAKGRITLLPRGWSRFNTSRGCNKRSDAFWIFFARRSFKRAASVDGIGPDGSDCFRDILRRKPAGQEESVHKLACPTSNGPVNRTTGAAARLSVRGVEHNRLDLVIEGALRIEIRVHGQHFYHVAIRN